LEDVDPNTPEDLAERGGPYTLGNEGAVPELGLEFPPVPPPVEVVGDSGGTVLDPDSVIRERE